MKTHRALLGRCRWTSPPRWTPAGLPQPPRWRERWSTWTPARQQLPSQTAWRRCLPAARWLSWTWLALPSRHEEVVLASCRPVLLTALLQDATLAPDGSPPAVAVVLTTPLQAAHAALLAAFQVRPRARPLISCSPARLAGPPSSAPAAGAQHAERGSAGRAGRSGTRRPGAERGAGAGGSGVGRGERGQWGGVRERLRGSARRDAPAGAAHHTPLGLSLIHISEPTRLM
jgi:hypothetical protein